MQQYLKFLLMSVGFFIVSSCDKTVETNEEELITTIIYTLQSTTSSDIVTLKFSDSDGIGGKNPIIITDGKFKVGQQYSGTILLLNESNTPIIDITKEIKDEGEDHQFFYELSSNLKDGLAISYVDKDVNGQPIGINTTANITKSGMGTLKITLRHQPNKDGEGVINGQITNAGGETDVEVIFDIEAI